MTNNQVVNPADKHKIAIAIEEFSEDYCIDHLGSEPGIWYTGGSDHNDDRLKARVIEGEVVVTDGVTTENYDGGIEGVEEYVMSWLEALWESREDAGDEPL